MAYSCESLKGNGLFLTKGNLKCERSSTQQKVIISGFQDGEEHVARD